MSSYSPLTHATARPDFAMLQPDAIYFLQSRYRSKFFEYLAITHGMQGFFCPAPHPCHDTHRTTPARLHWAHLPQTSYPIATVRSFPHSPRQQDRDAPAENVKCLPAS